MPVLNKVNDHILIEYDQDLIEIPNTAVRRVVNTNVNELLLANRDADLSLVGNVLDRTTVKLINGKYAVIDKDGSYYYPDVDDNVTIESPTLPDGYRYNRIRVHILSGYNFVEEDLYGFNLECYIRTNNDNRYMLASYFYDRSDTRNVVFNPVPITISQSMYDKYIEFYIISPKWLFALGDGSSYDALLPSEGLATGNDLIYFDYKDVSYVDVTQGYTLLSNTNQVRYSVLIDDKFSSLSPSIQESTNGDYYEYMAKWGSDTIEDLIYRLNSGSGGKYYVIHDIELWENIGNTKVLTHSHTTTQTSEFDKPLVYRPIIRNQAAVSYTISYTVRLYNSGRGDAILKMGSYSSNDVSKYGKFLTKLNINTQSRLKIYNKIDGSNGVSMLDDIIPSGAIQTVYRFVNVESLVINDFDSGDNITTSIGPFDNFIVFDVKYRNDGSLSSYDLSVVGDAYQLAYFTSAGELAYINDTPNDQYKRSNGKLVFKIPSNIARTIIRSGYDNFYVINRSGSGEPNIIFEGKFEKPISDTPITRETRSNNPQTGRTRS